MPEQTVTTNEFGVMTLDITGFYYETEFDTPCMKSKTILIAVEDLEKGVKRLYDFLAWLKVNDQVFKLALEREIQNYDLVWDNVWDSILGKDWVDAEDGFLAEYLSYESVDFDCGKLHLWIDTSGLHTDHMIRVTMNEAMQIECCEMM